MKILSIIKPERNYDIDFSYTNEDETLLIVGISLNKAAIEGRKALKDYLAADKLN